MKVPNEMSIWSSRDAQNGAGTRKAERGREGRSFGGGVGASGGESIQSNILIMSLIVHLF